MAHGIWPLAVDFWLSAKRIVLVEASSHPPAAWQESLVEPLGAKWRPKAAKEDPKADTERHKVAKARPDGDHKAPSSEKSRKKLSEACSRAAPNHEKCRFSLGFCMFRCKPMAYGIWPLAVDFRLSA